MKELGLVCTPPLCTLYCTQSTKQSTEQVAMHTAQDAEHTAQDAEHTPRVAKDRVHCIEHSWVWCTDLDRLCPSPTQPELLAPLCTRQARIIGFYL